MYAIVCYCGVIIPIFYSDIVYSGGGDVLFRIEDIYVYPIKIVAGGYFWPKDEINPENVSPKLPQRRKYTVTFLLIY